MVPAYVALSIVVEFLLILFHLSVTAFIARHIVVGPKQYRNAFFIIYLLQSVADLADYLTVQYLIRLPQYDVIPSSIVEPVGPLLFFGTAYFQFFQCLSHTAIAMNRYTAIRHPTRHENIWHGRLFGVILVVLFSVPFLAAMIRLWFKTSVVHDGGGYQLMNNDPLTDVISGVLAVAVATTTCSCSAYLEFKALAVYRNLNYQRQREHNDDYRLLVYAIISLVSQLLMASIWGISHIIGMHSTIGQAITKASLPYVIDLLSLSGPVCLLITSQSIRMRYMKFYGLFMKSSRVTAASYATSPSDESHYRPRNNSAI